MRHAPTAALAALLCLLPAGMAAAQTPSHLWSKRFGDGGLQSVSALATRSTLLWLAGSTLGPINLGGSTFDTPDDIFIAQFTTDGVHNWSDAFGSNGSMSILSIGVDTANNLYITGQFSSTVDFGGGVLTSAGSYDIFLARFSSTGAHVWSKRFGDAGLNQAGLALAVDASNNVIIGGRMDGSVDFGGGALTSAGGMDAFVAKFNSAGTHVWSKRFGDASNQNCNSVAVVSTGDIYLAGDFAGAINLGGTNFVSAGGNDAFLAKLNSAGTHQWSQSYGDASPQYGVDVDSDGTGVFLLGHFQGTINLGGTPLTSAGGNDVYVARFSTAGAHAWSKHFGDGGNQYGAAIDASTAWVNLTGYGQGYMDFGRGPLGGDTSDDIYLARLGAVDGAHGWSATYGRRQSSDYAIDLVALASRVYLGGYFDRDISFGFGSNLSAPSRGLDAYVAAFGLNSTEPLVRSIDDLGNDQGRKVTVRFTRAEYDATAGPAAITGYQIYLRDDVLPAAAPDQSGAAESWFLMGEHPAHGLGEYYTLASTLADAVVGGDMHASVFKVRAITADPAVYFDSPVAQGYSYDNLAPGLPQNLVIEDNVLSWRAPADPDVAFFTVYGASGRFDEGAQRIKSAPATQVDLTGLEFTHYYVTATDHGGNESPPAAVGGAPPLISPRALSIAAFPNPFNPATTIRYEVPIAGPVAVDIFDAGGARVIGLVDAQKAAGEYAAHWQGHDAAGRPVASGIYFARIRHAGSTRAVKLVVVK